jgi:hypothetical protein
VVGRRFQFENPFLWKTKTDVVELLRGERCADLVGDSTSCGHTWELTKKHTHCGMCSQCIDRRLAVLAAGVQQHDPEAAYVTNPVAGSPPDVYAKTLIVAYMELVERVERMTAAEFLAHFGEVSRVLRHCPGPASAAALQVYHLYRRHAEQVRGAVNRATAERVDEVTRRTLPRECLLRLVYEGGPDGGEAAAPPAPRPAGNYFIRRGDFWAVRFGVGEEKYYRAERGFDYLRALLEHPRRVFQAAELHTLVQPPPATGPHGATSADAPESGTGTVGKGDPALDDAALAALQTRLRVIEEARQVIEASDSPTRLDELDELAREERAIRARLKRDRGLGGRARKIGDVRNQLRNRVGNALRRALQQVEKYDKPLAAHLRRPVLTTGHTLSYNPDSTVAWAVEG